MKNRTFLAVFEVVEKPGGIITKEPPLMMKGNAVIKAEHKDFKLVQAVKNNVTQQVLGQMGKTVEVTVLNLIELEEEAEPKVNLEEDGQSS